jgi:hypothetical protein
MFFFELLSKVSTKKIPECLRDSILVFFVKTIKLLQKFVKIRITFCEAALSISK